MTTPDRIGTTRRRTRVIRLGRPRGRSAAFTLVELLVVIGVIGALVAIMVVAVQATREAARRMRCQNKIRQISLATHNFYDAYRRFPPGQCGPEFGGWGADSRSWSWLARLLPYLEETNVYQEGHIPRATLRESKVADRQLPVFLCPSDAYSHQGPQWEAGNFEGEGFPLGVTNYKGVSGANWGADVSLKRDPIDTQWINEGTNGSRDGLAYGDGILWRIDIKFRIRIKHISDGLSHTFLIGEDLPEHNQWCTWPYSSHAYGTCAIAPNYIHENTYSWENTHSFRSAHPGGLNFGFADGSAVFIGDDIDLEVYRAMATRAGGESTP